jgi:hypothetical protein
VGRTILAVEVAGTLGEQSDRGWRRFVVGWREFGRRGLQVMSRRWQVVVEREWEPEWYVEMWKLRRSSFDVVDDGVLIVGCGRWRVGS